MLETTIEIGVDLFKDLIFSSWQAVSGYAKDKYRENDPFGKATKKYIGGLIERYNHIKVLGMREPVQLKNLYVRANILEKITSRAGLRPEDLAEYFDFDRRTFGKQKEAVDGIAVLNKLQKFIVLGKPGAGKTTYLKYLTLMMFDKDSEIEQRRLPVFVTLREWADEKKPLMDFVVEQFNICGFEKADLFVERMLSDGQCLLLFDGLDEVSQELNQDEIIRQIRNFSDKYSNNQFIISCRVAAYNHWFERFTDVEMADFDEKQMEAFIKNWFHKEPKVANECWERLNSSPPLRELASVPLLLTLLCLEYSESNAFPPNRAELYKHAIETLLTKWDISRRIRRDDVYKQLSIRHKESMFARIAFGSFSANEYFMRGQTLAKMIEHYIENLPGFNPAELEPDSRAVLKSIEAQHGIFVERAKDVYSFAHLTFQEYFTAKYIVDNAYKENLLEKLVAEHLYDKKWREVFLLVAGMLDNADELLWRMRVKANEALEVSKINAWFKKIQDVSQASKSDYPAVFVRNLVVVDIAFSLAFGLDSYIDFDSVFDSAVAIGRAIASFLVFDFAIDLDSDGDKLKELYAFNKQNHFDMQDAQILRNYLSANLLILNCLKSGCYVSKDLREKLIHELFLPKGG
ncbi:MAG: NACHT domain-containing protein [Saprospiraceae bacterium]